jgi:hypothetical protein
MALVSPGVEVTVIDESQYIPSAVNTVPYILVASAQNKVSSDGITVAAGTLAANANKTYLITSQRDLAATFGVPFFYSTTTGTPINGYELNEYGLLAAYSALGVTNRCYVQRVDVNLTDLTASLSRPVGTPANGTYWLDTSTTTWGIQEWNQTTSTFTVKTPLVIDSTADVVNAAGGNYTPLATVGSIGDYAVVAVSTDIPGYYKSSVGALANTWVVIGDDDWKSSWPTFTGTNSPASLSVGANMYLNDVLVAVPATNTVTGFAAAINSANIPGVSAAAVSGKLAIYANSLATNDGSTGNGGVVAVDPGPNSGAALLTALGIVTGEYRAPTYFPGYSYQAPRWRTTDTAPRPTGSVWNNLSAVNNGASIRVKKYSSTLATFVAQTTNIYSDDVAAIYALDPVGGGKNIPVGTTYAQYDASFSSTSPNSSFSFEIVERAVLGQTVVTGTTTPVLFTANNSFIIEASEAGTETVNTGTAIILGTTVSSFIAAVSAANVPYVSASVNSAGNIVLTHSQGGIIAIQNVVGTPITTAGFSNSTTYCRPDNVDSTVLILSNWVTAPEFTYTASNTAPDQDPADGRLWYYSTVSDADIMIQDNGLWKGYQLVSNDVRGFDLTNTNASGPIIAATEPLTQNDVAESPLQYGDLWIDSSDLENYPVIYRWQPVSGVDQWVAINTADQTTQDGIVFADARWAPNGTTDPVADPFPTITSLLISNYLDLDAIDPNLYPQGMLMWNTRRSGYNVKSYQNNYFNSTTYPDATLPVVTSTWLTASGNKDDGSMWSGRQAQRQLVVQALKSGLDTSAAAREEQNQFNIIAVPAYPELIPNMIALSNERSNT